MAISEIERTDVVTAEPDAGVTDLVATMADESVGSVIITENDEVRGIVTDREIALALRDSPDVPELSASDVMTEDPVTASEDTGVFELIGLMDDEGIRRVPIVEDGTLSGIVTLDDIIVLLSTEFGNVGDVIEKQSPRF